VFRHTRTEPSQQCTLNCHRIIYYIGIICQSSTFIAKTALLLTLSYTLNPTSAALCNSALGMRSGAIRNAQITASSIWNKYHAARLARMGTVKRGRYVGAWCARHNNHHQWLKVDFKQPMKITKIETQGRQDTNQWVTRYQLSYSQDGAHWTLYRQRSNDKVKINPFFQTVYYSQK